MLRERSAAHRLVDPALFADRRFSWGTAATVAVSVALFGILFVLPQYLQSVVGDDPISAGLRLLPMMAGLLVAGGAAGQLVRAAGTKLTVAAGLALLAGGLVMLSQVHLATGYPFVAAGLALCGLGIGASIAAAMNAVMAAVGGDEAGIGASLNSALRQVGGAIAVAVLGSVLSSHLCQRPAARPRRPASPGRRHRARFHHPGRASRQPPAIRRPRPANRRRNRVPARHEHRHAHLRRRRRRRHPRQPAVSAGPCPLRRRAPAAGPRGRGSRRRYAIMTL